MIRYITKTIFCIAVVGIFWTGFASANVSDELLELSKKIEELTKKEQELKSGIAKKQEEAESLFRDIAILNAQILKLQTSISLTEHEIESTGLQIQRVRQEIFDIEDVLNGKKDAMSAFLRELDEADNKNLAAILLSNGSISDFFGEIEYVNEISGNITVALRELREAKEKLIEKEGILSDKKTEAEKLNVKYKSNKSALGGTKERKDNLLVTTKGQEEEYKEMLSEVEKEKARFFEELKQFEQKARNEGIFIVNVKSSVPPKQKKYDWPEDDYVLTQGYGYTLYARRGAYGGAPHNGIDMASGEGTFIKAVSGGKTIAKGYNDGFGNWAAIQHFDGLVSLYAHLKSPSFLTVDEEVRAGDIVGYEGSTGNSTGSHLHLSLYYEFFTYINEKKNNQVYFNYFDGTLNPLDYLK